MTVTGVPEFCNNAISRNCDGYRWYFSMEHDDPIPSGGYLPVFNLYDVILIPILIFFLLVLLDNI